MAESEQHPTRISKYELVEYLGGGMSRVYRARDTLLGRTVCVKILTEQASADPEAKARFLQEARVAGNLSHDNVIRVYDFGEDQGRPFMVMEFIEGEDLRQVIRSGRGDLEWKIPIGLQIARAIGHIHQHRIIHRDIKPENIHVTTKGVVKLMDFGIAKAEDVQLTRTGFTLGTPYYMAPEQVRGEQPTPLMDVYAYGVMFFELLTGVRPTEGDTIEQIFYTILYQPLDLAPLDSAPRAVRDLVARCTSKNPAERPQSFGEVCGALEAVLADLGQAVLPVPEGAAAAAPAPARVATPPAVPAELAQTIVTPPALLAATPAPRRIWPAVLVFLIVVIGGIAGVLRYMQWVAEQKPKGSIETSTGRMVLVPEGQFLSGKDKTETTVKAFYIDRTEVTNEAYGRFCQATGRPLPQGFASRRVDLPVVNITCLDAQAFAKWAGKRLPTALEWEKAARGVDGRSFPWGSKPGKDMANVRGYRGGKTPGLIPADSLADAASPFGAVNMIGNVWEFVDDLRTPSLTALSKYSTLLSPQPTAFEPWYAIRGGAFNTSPEEASIWDFAVVPARYRSFNIGFRCAKDVQ